MHNTLRRSGNQSRRATLSDPDRACICPGCPQHIKRLEELNAQLARANDTLRRTCDDLRRRLDKREAA